jgi:hypothetical protein
MTPDALCCSPSQHTWGPTERRERTMGGTLWHWCRCVRCGAHGFKTETELGVSQVTRCWAPCDASTASTRSRNISRDAG